MATIFSLIKDGVLRLTDHNGTVLSMDLEGRVLFYSNGNLTYRRTMRNRYLKIHYNSHNREVTVLSHSEGKAVEKSIIEFISSSLGMITKDEVRSIIEYIIEKGPKYMDIDAEKFFEVYGGEVPIVPPDQYFPVYLQATEGCYWNKCSFCKLYRGKEYHVKNEDEFEQHLNDVKEFFGLGISARKGVFLGDANSIIIDQELLVHDLELISKGLGLPVYSFIDSITTQRVKTGRDFAELSRLGLKRVYLGLESGSSVVLEALNKPLDLNGAYRLITDVKKSGISVGIILLAGAGGRKYYMDHIEESSDFISALDLDREDIVYISPIYIYRELPYAELSNELGELNKSEKETQLQRFKAMINEKYRMRHNYNLKAPVVVYDLVESVC